MYRSLLCPLKSSSFTLTFLCFLCTPYSQYTLPFPFRAITFFEILCLDSTFPGVFPITADSAHHYPLPFSNLSFPSINSDSQCVLTYNFSLTHCWLHLIGVFSHCGRHRGARNPNLQVVVTHVSHVCSQHSFGLPPKMNGMHVLQFDHVRLDLLSLVF